jgi:DNA adenine methylase
MPLIEGFSVPQYVRSKTHCQSPFRYPGGKYYALKHILPFILSEKYEEYREPFVGGGSVFFALPKAQYNIINDLDDELINVYRILADPVRRHELIQLVSDKNVTRDIFQSIVDSKPKNLMEKGFRTFYINRTSYSGILNKPSFGYNDIKSSPPKNWHKRMNPCGEKLEDVEIMSKDFTTIINRPSITNSVLMYLDPPYFEADQKRAYTKSFSEEDHQRLFNELSKTQHKFCLSYDDCEWVRNKYKSFNIFQLQWQYNTDNISNKKRKMGKELIITNYLPNWI